MVNVDITPDYCRTEVLVLGCGNVLLGDDGFGPSVIEYMQADGPQPEHLCLVNAGTSVREILFNIVLSDRKPQRIVVVDAMAFGGRPGAVTELSLDEIPPNKIDDFSLHQMPTSNLLRELRDECGVAVQLVVCQPAEIPDHVKPGLSGPVQHAIKQAAEIVLACSRPEELQA